MRRVLARPRSRGAEQQHRLVAQHADPAPGDDGQGLEDDAILEGEGEEEEAEGSTTVVYEPSGVARWNRSGRRSARTPPAIQEYLLRASAQPFFEMLRGWVYRGECDDPYGEFCVAEDVDAEKTAVARDYNASYWDERFTSDVEKAAGGAVKSHLAKVLTAGKYRVVLRDAACSGEDNELEATWAALTPADVVEDAAGRLARAIDRAYAASAAELKAVLFERERGLEKLRVLKRFFLAGQGDFLANFLDLADAELRKPAQKASPTRLARRPNAGARQGEG